MGYLKKLRINLILPLDWISLRKLYISSIAETTTVMTHYSDAINA